MRSSANPIVSIVLPVYNSAAYLLEAIRSVLGQTFHEFELVAVDDGSDDGSDAILDHCSLQDERVRVFHSPHQGPSGARNCAIRLARGEFLATLDSDDVASPLRLRLQVDYLRRNPECVVVGGQGAQIDPDGDPIAPLRVPLRHDAIEQELFVGRGSAIIHSAAMCRRAAVVEVGGYDEGLSLSEDLDLYLRLAEHGRLANLPDLLVRQRRHLGSVTAQCDQQNALRVKERVLRAALKRRGLTEDQVTVKEFYYPRSLPELYLAWTVMALGSRHPRTALKYGRRFLQQSWNDPRPWCRFFGCGLANCGRRAWRLLRGEERRPTWHDMAPRSESCR
ncbi:MAG: glycosyltransferase family 2 protein [Isosphaeraceae bacterium]|nr:glycosyltransferase family 2 protein [Isosphaeraceae bacterium]